MSQSLSTTSTKLPTIPEYFQRFVNKNVDLETETSIPCPFHHEQKGKSFTYSPSKGIFRCWGACHTGGDVYELHRLNFRLRTKAEAKKSLNLIYGIDEMEFSMEKPEVHVRESVVNEKVLYGKALRCARTITDKVELVQIMSVVPVDIAQLENYVNRRV